MATVNKIPEIRCKQLPGTFSFNNFGNVSTDCWEAYTWEGKARAAATSNRLPVLYHRGTWLTAMGYPFNAADPLAAFPYLQNPPTDVRPVTRQYGESPFGTKGRLIRLPNTILYNGQFKPHTSSVQVTPNEFDYVDGVIDGCNQTLLARRNIFTAACPFFFARQQFVTQLFPRSAPGSTAVDDTKFLGGRLLVVYGFDLTNNPYFFAGGMPNPSNPLTTAKEVFSRCIQRFPYRSGTARIPAVKFLIYGRYATTTTLTNPTSVAQFYAALNEYRNDWLALQDGLRGLENNIAMQGPFGTDQDLTGQVRNDVNQWLTDFS